MNGIGDRIFKGMTILFAVGIAVIFTALIIILLNESQESIRKFGFSFLTSSAWNPVTGKFGALIPIIGTLTTTGIALLAGVPAAVGIALFLSELAPRWMREPFGVAIELLAAVPSIVYGMWGLFVLSPIMAEYVQPVLKSSHLAVFSGPCMGFGTLTAGLVLALMIIPFGSSVVRDIFLMVPAHLKESAYGIGCTKWEVVRNIMIPYGKKGIAGAVFLGMGRALGETMAVTFVIGNSYTLSTSLFMPGNTIASTLANEFTEADGDIYLSSLIELGLILFLITFIVLGISRVWIGRKN
jgi:phosphate transport system permease protein